MTLKPFLPAFALIAALCVQPVSAREFEDKFGRVINADLISHTGMKAGLVTIKKDGKELQVKVAAFSEEDQRFIFAWMKKTPPTIKYEFRVDAEKKSVKSEANPDEDHQRFDIKLTSLTRQPVAGLKIEYRVYMLDYPSSFEELRDQFEARGFNAAGGIPQGRDAKVTPQLEHYPATKTIAREIKYNQTATIATKAYTIHSAKNPLNGDRYKDDLIGVIVRVYEPGGKMVFEHRDKKTKDYVWNLDDRIAF